MPPLREESGWQCFQSSAVLTGSAQWSVWPERFKNSSSNHRAAKTTLRSSLGSSGTHAGPIVHTKSGRYGNQVRTHANQGWR
jgi:hypothetical protein